MIQMNAVAPLVPSANNRDDVPAKWFFGAQTWLHATTDSTGGAITTLEQIGDPGSGSPYHLHHNEDEMFYVIDGSVRFVSGDERWVAGPGTWVFLPREIPHGFEVAGNGPARYLLLTTPSGFDGFVQEFWTDAPAPPDLPKIMEAAERYGIDILGPLPE
ncbi:MAG: cupin domain-containing protein [Thermomicrobiales bacterium]|nr:cupin domain-containing protein [Thermomicrobiales bacterium]MCO5221475.1 cupin domain-containing protein [Thermomicrobiales bacterium]